jgi:hypothetical protein
MSRTLARLNPLPALVAIALLGLGLAACGGSGDDGGSTSTKASTASVAGGAAAGAVGRFGHAADPLEERAIAALVERYYAAAASDDGASACVLLYFILAESTPEMYGRAPGPRYLQGAATCQAVLSRVFEHFHAQLAVPPRVTAVRVDGDRADALLEWTALPVGFMELRREGEAWRIDRVLAAPLR